jgi:hypothetical protein
VPDAPKLVKYVPFDPAKKMSEASATDPRGAPQRIVKGAFDYLYAGSLFTHQLSHIWIDFRKIQDSYMRDKGFDYFENSRRASAAKMSK